MSCSVKLFSPTHTSSFNLPFSLTNTLKPTQIQSLCVTSEGFLQQQERMRGFLSSSRLFLQTGMPLIFHHQRKKKINSSALQFVIGRTPLFLIDVFLGQQAFVAFSGPDKDTQMGPLEMGPIVVAFLWRLTNETCGCY